MKSTTRGLVLTLAAGLIATAGRAGAADFDDSVNRFHIGARMAINLNVDFTHSGPSSFGNVGPAEGGGIDRFYADGSVRVDASGNADGKTWYWSYDNASQVSADGTSLAMHGYSGLADVDSTGLDDDPQWGAEVSYTRILGEWAGAKWGFELGVTWLDFRVEDASQSTVTVSQVTDSYALDGVIPPSAPYSGTFEGPGPVISDVPIRSTTQSTSVIDQRQSLEGQLWGFKLGPVMDIPMGDWLSAQLSGGLAATLFSGDFEFNDQVAIGGVQSLPSSASTSSEEWVWGGYARGQITIRITESAGIYAAAEYLGSENYHISTAGREAKVDLSGGVFFGAGLTLRF